MAADDLIHKLQSLTNFYDHKKDIKEGLHPQSISWSILQPFEIDFVLTSMPGKNCMNWTIIYIKLNLDVSIYIMYEDFTFHSKSQVTHSNKKNEVHKSIHTSSQISIL